MSLFRDNGIFKTTLFHVAAHNEELTELVAVMNFYTCQVYDRSGHLKIFHYKVCFLQHSIGRI